MLSIGEINDLWSLLIRNHVEQAVPLVQISMLILVIWRLICNFRSRMRKPQAPGKSLWDWDLVVFYHLHSKHCTGAWLHRLLKFLSEMAECSYFISDHVIEYILSQLCFYVLECQCYIKTEAAFETASLRGLNHKSTAIWLRKSNFLHTFPIIFLTNKSGVIIAVPAPH